MTELLLDKIHNNRLKVSVLTPVLNGEATIADAIESVLSQTYKDVEHIIADGGSSDKTLLIARKYADLYPDRIKIISGKDSGIYQGNNRALEIATGDVIGVLNCDDYFSGMDVLQTLIDRLRVSGADAVYGDVRYVGRHSKRRTVRYYSSASFNSQKMLRGFMPAHPSFYSYRELYNEFGNFDESFRLAGDFELMLRMIYKGAIKLHYVPKECVTMRWGGQSTQWRNIMTILREHQRAYKKNGIHTTMLADASRYLSKITEFFHFF